MIRHHADDALHPFSLRVDFFLGVGRFHLIQAGAAAVVSGDDRKIEPPDGLKPTVTHSDCPPVKISFVHTPDRELPSRANIMNACLYFKLDASILLNNVQYLT